MGIILGHKEAKKEIYPNYDLAELTAKIDSLNAKKDTSINHYQTIIKNEKTLNKMLKKIKKDTYGNYNYNNGTFSFHITSHNVPNE